MRASFLAVATSAVVVLVSTWSETRTRSVLHSDSLARYEAITSYCGKIDPGSATEYAARLEDLTRGHSADEILTSRTSDRYRGAMAEANATLASASRNTAINGCTEFLAEKE
jgi:hypothetical protein